MSPNLTMAAVKAYIAICREVPSPDKVHRGKKSISRRQVSRPKKLALLAPNGMAGSLLSLDAHAQLNSNLVEISDRILFRAIKMYLPAVIGCSMLPILNGDFIGPNLAISDRRLRSLRRPRRMASSTACVRPVR